MAYISNAELLIEIAKSKVNGKITDRLAVLYLKMVDGHAARANWRQYSYVEELKCKALLQLCQVGLSFNPERSSNPHAYYWQVIVNAFRHELKRQQRHADIRDDLLEQAGLTPSIKRQGRTQDEWDALDATPPANAEPVVEKPKRTRRRRTKAAVA